jgi:hypothetical protein
LNGGKILGINNKKEEHKMNDECMVIGGSMDGEWLNAAKYDKVFGKALSMKEDVERMKADPVLWCQTVVGSGELYILRSIPFGSESFRFYALKGVTDEEGVKSLVEKLRRSACEDGLGELISDLYQALSATLRADEDTAGTAYILAKAAVSKAKQVAQKKGFSLKYRPKEPCDTCMGFGFIQYTAKREDKDPMKEICPVCCGKTVVEKKEEQS